MNKIYRLVWNTSQGGWVVASEHAKEHGKQGGSHVIGEGEALVGRESDGFLRVMAHPSTPIGAVLTLTAALMGGGMSEEAIGAPGLFVNDSDKVSGADSGCIRVLDTGAQGQTGWQYLTQADNPNAIANCDSGDKASQTGRVLFYGSGTQTGSDSLTLGNELFVNGGRLGLNDVRNGTNAMAIGNVSATDGTTATGQDSIAIGNNAQSSAASALALGTGAVSSHDGSVALGAGSVANGTTLVNEAYLVGGTATGEVNIGDRRITGLSAGADDTDAVNVAQLTAAQTHYYSVNDNGTVGGNYNNDGATGINALAAGVGATATGRSGIAMGDAARSTNNDTIAVGHNAVASSANSAHTDMIAIGLNSSASNDHALAIGTSATASSNNTTAVGANAVASGAAASALGHSATASGSFSTAVGSNAVASRGSAVAIGNGSNAAGDNSAAIGYQAATSATNALAIGNNAKAQTGANSAIAIGNAAVVSTGAVNSIALGNGATASITDGVALGAGSVANTAAGIAGFDPLTKLASTDTSATWKSTLGAVSVGDAATGKTRQITGVAAGLQETDAVNVAQLKGVADLASAGWNVSDADGNSANIGPNGNVTFSGDSNIGVAQSGADQDGQVTVTLNRDLDLDSVTMGDTLINNAGLTINNGPSITVGGIDMNHTRITNLAPGVDGGDAVNVDQLTDVRDLASAGWNVSDAAGNSANIGPNGNVTFSGDSNIGVAQSGADQDGQVTVTLNRDLDLDSVTMGDTLINNAGLTINNGPSITVGGIDMNHTRITNLAPGVDGSDAVNLDQLNAQGGELTTRGLDFAGNEGDPVHRNLGETLIIRGGATTAGTYSGANLKTVVDPNTGIVSLQMADAPKFGDITINDNGKITGIADGDVSADSTDAINGSQLFDVSNQINNINNGGGIKYFHANSVKADSQAIGTDSIAVGPNAQASGAGSIAMGDEASASGAGSTAVGQGANASASGSVALGQGASDNGRGAESYVGKYSNAQNDTVGTVSVGNAATGETRTISNVADGRQATDAVNLRQLDGAVAESKQYTDDSINQVNTTVTNVDNRVTNVEGTVNRIDTYVTNIDNGTEGMFQVNNTSRRAHPRPTGADATAGGAGAIASGANSTAIGSNAQATADNSVALGANSVADRANSVSVGSAGNERQITNVGAGTAGTDAVNLDQLNKSVGSVANNANAYTDSRYNALKNDLDEQDDTLSAGIAGAMAMASLPQPYEPGASMAAVGVSGYRGQSALSVGVSRISDNGKWVTKLQGSADSQGEVGVGVGVGYQW
ncbi:YadA-like family protein [Pseudomonas jinjuensis]|uniref:Head domain of trimeric autotransporter adhesin n=1 Tax=Pseudomonas jinjuensis TaxID=198616 RepID=A0A1H0E725_9PSED|nr:YadA-like family protein [Pseudomonas jinjuensis]SDN78155.1 Head domain of trimeric autotransporter adhesin [Pseudomonas jinjuensis]